MSLNRRLFVSAALGGLAAPIGEAFGQASEPLRSFTIPSASMHPNLLEGDVVLTRWTGRPGAPPIQRGDVVIFRREGRYWVKRVIGLPGDLVGLRRGAPVVNGAALHREDRTGLGRPGGPKLLRETLDGRSYRIQEAQQDRHRNPKLADAPAQAVPAQAVFVLGDNRFNSVDSRTFGPVLESDLRFVAIQVALSRDPARIGFRLDRSID